MSDALEKARDNLYRSLSSIPAAMAIEALVNAILDAREAKAEQAAVPTGEYRGEDFVAWLRNGGSAEVVHRAEKAEAALAELRGRVTEAVDKLQWDIDHPATMGHDRGEIIAVLTHPTTPDALLTDPEAQPARDTDPVPATVLLIRESYRPAREGETPAFIDLEFGPMVRRKARSIARRAAGITGKGTSDE